MLITIIIENGLGHFRLHIHHIHMYLCIINLHNFVSISICLFCALVLIPSFFFLFNPLMKNTKYRIPKTKHYHLVNLPNITIYHTICSLLFDIHNIFKKKLIVFNNNKPKCQIIKQPLHNSSTCFNPKI